jgi:hypothetical protein
LTLIIIAKTISNVKYIFAKKSRIIQLFIFCGREGGKSSAAC